MNISSDVITTVRKNNPVQKVIGKYVKLKEYGSIHIGLSPFAEEKSPSFYIDTKSQTWIDYASGKSGDVFQFMALYHHVTIDKAIEMLSNGRVKLNPAELSEDEKVKQQMYDIYEKAATFYENQLVTNKVKYKDGKSVNRAYKYLSERGITDETIKKWRLGYSPDCWGNEGSLYHHLTQMGYSKDILIQSKLVKESAKSGKVFDFFRNRAMFPIRDNHSRVIGFGGRFLPQDPKEKGFNPKDVKEEDGPKYLNSSDNVIFDKSNLLFGLNERDDRSRNIILCEGYMDVISLQQAGFTDAVASLGTALTETQCKIIKEKANMVYLTYDADGPGIKAGIKAIYRLNKERLASASVTTKPFKDPDEMIKALGHDVFQKRLDTAKDSFAGFMETAKKGVKNIDVKKKDVKSNRRTDGVINGDLTPDQVMDLIIDGYNTADSNEREAYKDLIAGVYASILPSISGESMDRTNETISKKEFLEIFGNVVKEKEIKKNQPLEENMKRAEEAMKMEGKEEPYKEKSMNYGTQSYGEMRG